MNFQYWALSAWMLQISIAVHGHRASRTSLTDDDDGDRMTKRSASHRRVLVKYDTLIQYGNAVFTKPGVDTYSTISTDEERTQGIYVGARNWFFKFDLKLNETDAIEIPPSLGETERCRKTYPDDYCHNFITSIHLNKASGVGRVDVCGTFAYTPACSGRTVSALSTESIRIPGLSPKSPGSGVAAYFSYDQVVFGLVDPKTDTPQILSTKLNEGAPVFSSVESKLWLNQAEFVGAFSPSATDKFVYIVFREIAIEITAVNVTTSRVGRVCRDDRGGVDKMIEFTLASFTKASLDCGAEHPEVQSISYVENDPYFWATFTSHGKNETAICAFSITEMEDVFRGPYLHQDDQSLEWEEVPAPSLHEGDSIKETCFGIRNKEAVLNYTLMSNTVSRNCSVFMADGVLNKIAVSSPVNDVFTAFAGEDQGRIWKIDITNCDVSGDVKLWEVVPANQTSRDINGLAILNDSIIVLTNEAVLKILSQEEYPGEIIEPSSPKPMSSPAPRAPTTESNDQTLKPTSYANKSHSQFEFARSQTTIFLIATAILSSY